MHSYTLCEYHIFYFVSFFHLQEHECNLTGYTKSFKLDHFVYSFVFL